MGDLIMSTPVLVVVALLVAASTAYCLARCVVPSWRSEHGRAVDAWHVLMGVAMVAMLLAPVGSLSAAVQTTVFALGALWCACHLLARSRSGAHARLGLACAVMAAMLVPAMTVPAASAGAASGHEHHHHTPGMDMSAMDHGTMGHGSTGHGEMGHAEAGQTADQAASHAGHAMVMPPLWLAVLMLFGVAVIVVAAVRASRVEGHRTRGARTALACEIVMALSMGYMAAMAL